MTSPIVKLMDPRHADKWAGLSGKVLAESWWYLTLQALVAKDPSLAVQLDVGPMPGMLQDLDLACTRIVQIYAIHVDVPVATDVSGAPKPDQLKKPYRGVIGFTRPGRVMDRASLFASITTNGPEHRMQDVLLLANAYDQLSTYCFDTLDHRGAQAYCLPDSYHADALVEAGFVKNALLIKAARGLKRSWADVALYTKG